MTGRFLKWVSRKLVLESPEKNWPRPGPEVNRLAIDLYAACTNGWAADIEAALGPGFQILAAPSAHFERPLIMVSERGQLALHLRRAEDGSWRVGTQDLTHSEQNPDAWAERLTEAMEEVSSRQRLHPISDQF